MWAFRKRWVTDLGTWVFPKEGKTAMPLAAITNTNAPRLLDLQFCTSAETMRGPNALEDGSARARIMDSIGDSGEGPADAGDDGIYDQNHQRKDPVE